MTHGFDGPYWDRVWAGGQGGSMADAPPNPHLVAEVAGLPAGTALEAGCGAGTEAIWLAGQGWDVTAADIAAAPLELAARRSAGPGSRERISWVRADLAEWEPGRLFDLVTTHYAHPTIPQLDFYGRLAEWVAPGGTLFIVGHGQSHDDGHGHHHGHDAGHHHAHGHGHEHRHGGPPASASVTAAAIAARVDPDFWDVASAREARREVVGPGGRPVTLHDVVFRATRRG